MSTERNIVKLTLESLWKENHRIEIAAIGTPPVCTAIMKVPGEQSIYIIFYL